MDEELGQQSAPPSPPPKSSTPNHQRDASLQRILNQFDPLSSSKDKAPAPPPKDGSPTLPSSPMSKPTLPEKDVQIITSFSHVARRPSILSGERPPPAEPDQPFEFHRFLEQMR